ncbi:MAG: hypothetical protein HRU15_09795 [Planctomycetes bacterium]|nr:hypothetical protein [Planctomycetota bacterium]
MNTFAKQVFDQGFCVLEALYDENECQEMISILNNSWERKGKLETDSQFGVMLHPALKYAPELAPFYAKQETIDVMRAVLDDEVQMTHSGALLIDHTRDFCTWHCHLNGDIPDQWHAKPKEHRGQVDRLLCNVYLHGSNADVGQLLVYPRTTNNEWDRPFDACDSEWQGQQVLEFPAGSAVIFDTALWHAARKPTKSGYRFLFGGHYQGRHNLTSHREDNYYEGPEIEKYRSEIPLFASLL